MDCEELKPASTPKIIQLFGRGNFAGWVPILRVNNSRNASMTPYTVITNPLQPISTPLSALVLLAPSTGREVGPKDSQKWIRPSPPGDTLYVEDSSTRRTFHQHGCDLRHRLGVPTQVVYRPAVKLTPDLLKQYIEDRIEPLRRLQALLAADPMFSALTDPDLLTLSAKSISTEGLFLETLDHRNIGRFENVLYAWAGAAWSVIDKSRLESAAVRFLTIVQPSKLSEKMVRSILACASLSTRVFCIPEPSQSVVRVAFSDCTVEITDQIKAVKPDKKHGLRHSVVAAWGDREQPTPIFTRFISRILPDPAVRQVVLEYVGYTLLADTRYQVAQFWIGNGANGKSELAKIIAALHRQVVSLRIADLQGFGSQGLIGASLIDVDETPARIDEQALKSLISGDLICLDRKYQAPISLRPTAKWIIRGNALPAVSDQSDGFWRRLQLVRFSAHIPPSERDPMIGHKIINLELAGVASLVIHALHRLLQRGRFSIPAAMLEIQQELRVGANSVLAWVDDREVQTDNTVKSESSRIYQAYTSWCLTHGYKSVADSKFWSQLQAALPGLVKTRTRTPTRRLTITNVKFF